MNYNDATFHFNDFGKLIIIILIFFFIIIKLKETSIYRDKISVIIPTFNRGHLIIKSIKSVLNQTYPNIEILVVDDGSTDNTEKLIKNFDNNRIKYIKIKKNIGASHARNIGIMNASGKYISFQDSDDVYHIDKLEKQYNIYSFNINKLMKK